MNPEIEYELLCNGEFAASAGGPPERAWNEIMHYAMMYRYEGELELYKVTRERIDIPFKDMI